MILTLVGGCSLGLGLVSYETDAKRIPLVLDELGPLVGRKLSFDGAFKNEVVVLRADKSEAQTVLDRIADVTVGKWETVQGTLTLRPDVETRMRQEEHRMAGREAQIGKLLHGLREELDQEFSRSYLEEGAAALKDRGQGLEKFYANMRRTPEARLAMRCLVALGPARLARLESGDRIVLATHNPSSMQLAIPNRESTMAAYQREREIYNLLYSGTNAASSFAASSMRSRTQKTPGPRESKLETVLISVPDISALNGLVETTVVLSDLVVSSTHVLRGSQPVPPPPESAESNEPLPVSPLALEAGKLLSAAYRDDHPLVSATSALRPFFLDPVAKEPLTLGSEVYIEFAKRKKLNLAVCLNDGAFGRFMDDKVTMKQFELRNRPSVTWREESGWLLLTPSDPVGARRGRDDRNAIAAVVRAKSVDIDAKGNYVAQRYPGMASGIGSRIAALFHRDLVASDFSNAEHVFRFYGSLSPSQRRLTSLSAGDLNAVQRKFATTMIYGSAGEYDPEDSGEIRESTYALGGGLSGLVLRQEIRSTPGVWESFGSNGRIRRGMEHAAIETFFIRNHQYVTGKPMRPPAEEYEVYDSQTIRYTVEIRPGHAWLAQGSAQTSFDKAMKPAEFTGALRLSFDSEYAKLENMVKRGQPPRRIYGGPNGKDTILNSPPP